MRYWRSVLTTSVLVAIAGCASLNDQEWVQKTKEASVKAMHTVTGATARTAKRMQKYLEEKDVLQTFQDAGEHSEAAVLDVLHQAGIGKVASTTGKGGRPTTVPPTEKHPPPGSPATPEHFSGTLRWPLDAGIVSSEFGKRKGKMHKGMDIAADVGEPVYASADADVIYAGNGMTGYGNVVILRHDQQMTSLYAHNSELKVKQGEHVKQGTLIALLGSTGRSTGPHVHFEIREGDAPINPRVILPEAKLGESTQHTPTRVAHADD